MNFYCRLLSVIVFLTEKAFNLPPVSCDDVNVFFNQVRLDGLIIKGEIEMAELREGQQFTVTAAFKTAAGHPASYQAGTAMWASSDPSIASVEANPENELEATVKGVDGSNNGAALITFTADGDPDADETRDLVGTLDVVVTQGEAVVAELTPGPASDV